VTDCIIENRAEDIPFSYILSDLLTQNLAQHPNKMKVFKKLEASVAIDLPDIEVTVTLFFQKGMLRLEKGMVGEPELIIRTDSDKVMDLNTVSIRWGLPYYFDEAGRRVLKHMVTGKLKVKGLLSHPVKLTRLIKIMSVV
jgi:hypothetical protein